MFVTRSTVIGLTLALGLLSGCSRQSPPATQAQAITLYFYSESDLQNAFFDNPVTVMRKVPVSTETETMDTALELLFAGPTEKDLERGARTSDDLTRLGPLYLGIRRDGDAAVVNFHKDALEILNSAAARQFMTKEPIRRTLLQFPGITDVQYSIDGEIFEEWDA